VHHSEGPFDPARWLPVFRTTFLYKAARIIQGDKTSLFITI